MTLSLLMLAVAEWAFINIFELTAVGIPAKVFWSKVSYIGITSAPPLLLMFISEFVNHDRWMTRKNLLLLWLIPVVTLLMAITNEWHGLVWFSFTPGPDYEITNAILYGHGTWFWIALSYIYILISISMVMLVLALFRYRHIYRQQVVVLLIILPFTWGGEHRLCDGSASLAWD